MFVGCQGLAIVNNKSRPLSLFKETRSFCIMAAPEVSIGFLGCGLIASAIATGLAESSSSAFSIKHISVSKRSEKRSSELAAQFPSLVSVHTENQEVVDGSDIVFVCVLPQQVDEVLRALKFDASRHSIVSLVSTSTMNGLCKESSLPVEKVFKMICLPSVAHQDGLCLLLTPKQRDPPIITDMFKSLGGVVQADTEDKMSALVVTTGLMGSFYGLLRNNREFLVKNGISRSEASFLVARLYNNMMQDATLVQNEDRGYDKLVSEQTPGGLNEQGLKNLEALGGLDAYDKVQAALLSRIRGESDGSLP